MVWPCLVSRTRQACATMGLRRCASTPARRRIAGAARDSGFPPWKKGACPDFLLQGASYFLLKEPPKNLCQAVAPRVQRDPKREPMAFARAIRRPPIVAPEGVHFDLDTTDGRPRFVHCIATRAGLEFLAGRPLTIEQLDRIFNAHRLDIEGAARRKSNSGSVGKRVLTVTSSDLTFKRSATSCVDRDSTHVVRDRL